MDSVMNAQNVKPTGEARTIEIITAEINLYKIQMGSSIIEIGTRLMEAKEQLSHGEWGEWLKNEVDFSEVTAQRFMRIAREFSKSNPSPVTDLGVSKALILLGISSEERDKFISEKHEVNGEEKDVYEMSKRELEQAVKERQEALEALKEVQLELDGLKAEKEDGQAKLIREREEAEEKAGRISQEMEALRAQLEALKNEPKTYAEPDPELIAGIRAEAEKEAAAREKEKAEAALKKKLEKAEKEKERAEKAKEEAERSLAALKVQQERDFAVSAAEKKELSERAEELQKKLAVASSSEMTVFKVHFEAAQEDANRMMQSLDRMENAEIRRKLASAVVAFCQQMISAAESRK